MNKLVILMCIAFLCSCSNKDEFAAPTPSSAPAAPKPPSNMIVVGQTAIESDDFPNTKVTTLYDEKRKTTCYVLYQDSIFCIKDEVATQK